jgi:hypothetical protein
LLTELSELGKKTVIGRGAVMMIGYARTSTGDQNAGLAAQERDPPLDAQSCSASRSAALPAVTS